MIKDILKTLAQDKAENRAIIEKAINDCLKDENKETEVHLLTLYLGEYITDEEKETFFKETRPKTFLKLYELANKQMSVKDFDKALQIIEATLEYISSIPQAPAPADSQEEPNRYQFDSFAEMLIYCTKNPKEPCMWVAKDEVAFLKVQSYCLIEKKEFTKAKEVLNKVLAKNPMNVSSYLELFEISKLEKNLEEGITYIEKAYENVWYIEDFARMIRAYGFYYLEKGEYEKAKSYYLLSLMYDSSVEADKYVNNELSLIKEKQGKAFKVPPPAESAKFMAENKLPYLLPASTEVLLMRTLKKLYELKIDAQKANPSKVDYFANIITAFESNLKRVTLNKKELIDVVKTDVFTNKFMYSNKFFRFTFTADKVFRQMPPDKLGNSLETKNILNFLYRANERNLVEGFPITVIIDKICDDKALHLDMANDYIERLKKNGYTVASSKDMNLPLGVPATKIYIEKGKEKRSSYLFKFSPRAFGLVTCQVEYDGDINDSFLLEIVESWRYLEPNKSQLAEVLDKTYNGYHSLMVNGGIGKDKFLKFAAEVEFMLARLIPLKNKVDPLWEVTGRKLVVGYILKQLKAGVGREEFNFDKLRELLTDEKALDEFFNIDDEVIGYYTRPVTTTTAQNTKASYIVTAKEFLNELEK